MDIEEMGVLYRFADPGHPCFSLDYPSINGRFMKKFKDRGGMNARLSKHIGFQADKWTDQYDVSY
jgi:hypothetical protein